MTAKHHTAEYARAARIVKARVAAARAAGRPVICWRCHRPIMPGVPFDVGHLDPRARPTADNLAPEHRHRTATCAGNRADGGSMGAAIIHARNRRHTPAADVRTWPV